MYSSSTFSAMESNAAWLMFSFLAAIVGGILVYVLFVTLSSFALISKSFLGFLFTLIFGNLCLRLVLELLLMQISLWRNVREIRKNLDSKNK